MPNVNINISGIKTTEEFIKLISDNFGASLGDDFSLTSFDIFELEDLSYTYNKRTKKHEFSVGFTIEIAQDEEGEETQSLSLSTSIVITDTQPYKGSFTGQLTVPVSDKDNLIFDIALQKKKNTLLVGQLNVQEERDIGNVNLRGLVSQVSPNLASSFPEELLDSFNLNENLIFVIQSSGTTKSAKQRKMLFGIGFNTAIEFNKIPLVSKQLPPGIEASQFTIELLLSLQTFTPKELKPISAFLEEIGSGLKFKTRAKTPKIKPPSSSKNELQRGLSVAAYFNIGEYGKSWLTPLKRQKATQTSFAVAPSYATDAQLSTTGIHQLVASPKNTDETDNSPITIANNGVWLTVQKSFGPIHFEKVGLTYKEGEIHLTPQFVVQVSKFSLALNGLSISTALTNFSPHFNLDGFALEYLSDSLTIGGAFLHSENTNYEEYLGMVTLGMKTKGDKSLSLSAIGSYAYFDKVPHKGDVALFLYLAVDYPLGGPPFFFVTGLAGGFGYNHELIVPPLDKIDKFPLVAQAVNGPGKVNPDNGAEIIAKELESLDKYIPVSIGSGFLALGVKFTSFEMLDSFALLTLALNEGKFELNLIGISTLTVPTDTSEVGVDPVAVVQLALQARFAPNEGILLIRAQLTNNSYILSKKCHLTGGFAVAFWFAGEHAGDFVVTLGGYNPNFDVPDYYPTVPRLGLHWQLDNNTSITGEEYFALCSHAVMAGGRLALKYKEGSIWANLEVGADFLICWKPYYYDIHAYIHVSAGIGCISGSLGVDLHIWGPDFAGKAKIHLWIFSATVRFGANDSSSTQPITWNDFHSSFLPSPDKVCSVAASKGLVKQVLRGDEEVWIINPKDLELTTDSLIPAKQAYTTDGEYNTGTNQDFGINPMGVRASELHTSHRVTITQNSQSATGKFKYESLTKPAATGAWGEPKFTSGDGLELPEVNAQRFVENTFSGFRITPAQPPKAGETHEVGVQYLRYDPTNIENAYSWQTLAQFNANTSYSDSQRRNEIRNTIANNYQRNEMLTALGFDSSHVNVTSAVADSFVFAPEVN